MRGQLYLSVMNKHRVHTIGYPTSQNIKRVGDEVGFIPHTTMFQKKKKIIKKKKTNQ